MSEKLKEIKNKNQYDAIFDTPKKREEVQAAGCLQAAAGWVEPRQLLEILWEQCERCPVLGLRRPFLA